jgi:hypothetical protein
MTVGEQHQHHTARGHHQNGRDPTGGEALVEQRRSPVERLVAGQQRQKHHSEQDGLFVVEALEQRERHAATHQRHGDDECPLLAPLNTACQEQQERTDDAAHEVRQLEPRQRQVQGEPSEPRVDRRCRTREQQHHSSVEHRCREQRRNEARQATARGERQHPRTTRTDELAADQQHCRHDQREHVVDQAERRERREQRHHPDARPDGGQHHRLEHTEPTWDMAEQPCELG